MSGARYPHCPIRPGRGCDTCEDIDTIVRAAKRADRRRIAVAVLFVAAVIALAMLAAHSLSAA
jgi:hypothetical protein